MPKSQSALIKVGALWPKKKEDGEKYYSGTLEMKILCFKNESDHPQAPAYNVFVGKPILKRDDEDEEQPRKKSRDDDDEEEEERPRKKVASKDDDDDDAPF